MNPRNRSHPAAFTLLELVVVLAILAVVTSLAVRSVDRVEDLGRYEANLRIMQDIETAVLGSPDDRALDGTRILSGFVADMGRLPKTVLEGDVITLKELWARPDSVAVYGVREAITEHLVAEDALHEDRAVLVPGGWRGPYLRLPMEETALRDGWGNSMQSHSVSNPSVEPYARLRDTNDAPITVQGQEVFIVRHLGADGAPNPSGTVGVDQDGQIDFRERPEVRIEDPVKAKVEVTVQLIKDDGEPDILQNTEKVVVRVFGPSGLDDAKIKVHHVGYPDPTGPVIGTSVLPGGPVRPKVITGATIGHRVVRAYLYESETAPSWLAASAVKHIVLQPGVNFIPLTIYR